MLHILIVEDEMIVAVELQDILEDAGHRVVGIARTMAQALEIASGLPLIDLAIMDVDLADGPGGDEASAYLRERHGVASLFVSGRLGDALRWRVRASRPVGFVAKPYTPEDIVAALKALRD